MSYNPSFIKTKTKTKTPEGLKVQSLPCSHINLLQNKAGKSQVISKNYMKRLLNSPVPMKYTSLIHCPVVSSWETNCGETRPSDAPLACSREGSPNTNSGGNPASQCALWLLLLRPADHSLWSLSSSQVESSPFIVNSGKSTMDSNSHSKAKFLQSSGKRCFCLSVLQLGFQHSLSFSFLSLRL